MSDITILDREGTITVKCPYEPDFVERARRLQGKWNSESKRWMFPARHRTRVLAVLDEIYGYDESETRTAIVELKAERIRNLGEV